MNDLVIVESPTKAKTLSKFLGDRYRIEASFGHVRDLPKAEMGVDEITFEPKYIIPKDKTKRVNGLKKVATGAKNLWLATDPDREGEAIAWHITQIIGGQSSDVRKSEIRHPISDIRRVVFHEITPEAVKEAFDNPRTINMKLVDAQQARRVLDRLVGYKLSPLLWRKVKSGLSAGRVQSATLRLIAEREEEIEKFKPQEYWSIDALLVPTLHRQDKFVSTLVELNGKKISIKNKDQADKHVLALKGADYIINKITKKEVKRYPYPPFTTSTLQQVSSHTLGMTAKKTMSLAQFLYEHGLITYMRTDSVSLSGNAVNLTRSYIAKNLGKEYLPVQPRIYKTKSKLAQEAHEAIRPTNLQLTADSLRGVPGITRDHVRLYDLIWKRMAACQMKEAISDQTTVEVKASTSEVYLLRATGSVIKFDGWLKIYGKEAEEEGEKVLPPLDEGEGVELLELLPQQHCSEPPPRYNEASLIKKLEELGIGRPSTYAPTISTIQERFYVEKVERKFFPTPLGMAVTHYLIKNFPDIVDYDFTAGMEDKLDNIARGEQRWKPVMEEFYKPFEAQVEKAEGSDEKVKVEVEVVDEKCPLCGKNLLVRFGRFGKFLACSGFPECKYTQGFEKVLNIKCPQDGGEVVLRRTKKGRSFYGCRNYPACKFSSWTKPKTGLSLPEKL